MVYRARNALIGAAGGVVLLTLLWFVVFHVGWVERKDQSVLRGFVDLQRGPGVSTLANLIAGLCDPKPYFFLAALPVLVALRRRRLWLAVAVGSLLLGANVTTQVLKPLLAQPRPASLLAGLRPVIAASWPSGHATASMALALAWVLAVPGRLRPRVAAAGAVFSVAVCYSFLTLEWHYPSDVLGGYLVAGIWTLLAIAGVLLVEHGRGRSSETLLARRRSTAQTLGPAAVALGGTILLMALVLLARPRPVLDYASQHPAFVAGAGVIGLMALAVSTGISLMARR